MVYKIISSVGRDNQMSPSLVCISYMIDLAFFFPGLMDLAKTSNSGFNELDTLMSYLFVKKFSGPF